MKSLFALTLFAFAAAASAQTPPTAPTAAAAAPSPPVLMPVAKPAKARAPKAPKPVAAPNPNLVPFKTSTGKTIHYDCSKPGNKTKTACKK